MGNRNFWITVPVNSEEFQTITETASALGISRAAYVRVVIRTDLARRAVLPPRVSMVLGSPPRPPRADPDEDREAGSSKPDCVGKRARTSLERGGG